MSLQVHEARDDLGYDFEQADMQPSLTRDGKPGFVLTQGRPRQLVLWLAQPQTAFRVCRVGRVWLGNVRDEYGNVWDASWLPLRVATQRRTADGESFEVTLDWFASQTVLAQAAALRQVLQPLRPRLHRMRHSDTRGGSMA